MNLAGKQLLVLDFETFYDDKYTLKKMTIVEYLRDLRFAVLGLAVAENGEKGYYLHGAAEVMLGLAKLQERYGHNFENALVVSHNALFDMAINAWKFGIKPPMMSDTLALSRIVLGRIVEGKLASLLDYFGLPTKKEMPPVGASKEAWAEYAVRDVEGCRDLFWVLVEGLAAVLPPSTFARELDLINMTVQAFVYPQLKINLERVQKVIDREGEKRTKALESVQCTEKDLSSADKFKAVLEALGVQVPVKRGKNGEIPAVAKSDKFMQDLLEHEDDTVRTLAEARLVVKSTILRTRSERMKAHALAGAYPVPYKYYAAHTGRWGGSEKENPQNLPKKGDLRKSIEAPEGGVVITGDLSQIEARLLAYVAGQEDLVEGFRRNEDIYSDFATYAFETKVSRTENPELREVGKATVLGCGYGAGAERVFDMFRANPKLKPLFHSGLITLERVMGLVQAYRAKYTRIPEYWSHLDGVLRQMLNGQRGEDRFIKWGASYISIPDGMVLMFPSLQISRGQIYCTSLDERVKLWGGVLTENIIQAMARSILADQMVRAVQLGLRPAMTTHDEFSVRELLEKASGTVDAMRSIMTTPPSWAPDLPLATEIVYGREYQK